MGDWDVTGQAPIGEWDVVSHASEEPSLAGDVAKSGATGVAKGLMNFAGAAGSMREALSAGTDYLGQKLGAAPETVQKIKDYAALGARMNPMTNVLSQAPSAHDIQSKVEQYTGELHQPQTAPGRYAQSVGEFAGNPSSYLGPGSLLTKAGMAAASGLGSEGAADLASSMGFGETGQNVARVAGGLLGGPLAARGVAPTLAADQRALANAGVSQMTPGQLQGGLLKSIEDKATSWPILGEFIKNARGRSVEGFNRAVGNQALEPIGERLPSGVAAGHETIAEVERRLGGAYDRLIPEIHFVPDYEFAQDMARIRTDARSMPHSTARQFQRIINDRLHPDRWVEQQLLAPEVSNPGNLPAMTAPPSSIWGLQGRDFKRIEGELTNLAGKYTKSSDAGQQQLGEALTDVVRAMRNNIERVNPDISDELRRINTGWAIYSRMRDAGSRRATSQGVFTPNDLLNAVKRGDRSVGKGAFARGDALMQDFAEIGQRVLPNTVPDSGTTGRLLMAGMAGGSGMGAVARWLHRPEILAAGTAAVAPYTVPGQWLVNRYANVPAGGPRAAFREASRGAAPLRSLLANPAFYGGYASGGVIARRAPMLREMKPRATPERKSPSPFQQRAPNPFTS